MYIDAFLEREKNKILVVERDRYGKRLFQEYPTKYIVYWPSPKGKYPNIYGQMCEKFQTNKIKEFQREVGLLSKYTLFESDIKPVFRCLYDNYKDAPAPQLNVAFFDIEVDFDPLKGWSTPEDAFNPINAITLYLAWLERNFTMVIKPKNMSHEDAVNIINKFPDTVLCNDEKELLDLFLVLIEDADILSGWNSEKFDIPYIHNRILQQLDRNATRRLCLWNKFPNKREYNSFGKKAITYDLIGRVHIDYLQLFRKHTQQQLHSYSLEFVAEHEIKERKTPYDGSLDALYNNDFEKFIEYNRQDVLLIVKIDKKNKYIELANKLAHDNCVLLATTMGAVAMIDQAIVNQAHNMGFVVPNRKKDEEEEEEDYTGDNDDTDEDEDFKKIAGAYVADPKEGLHNHIGAVDLTSLYPSTIRALNMSTETIVGHIRPESTEKLIFKRVHVEKKKYAEAWNNMFSTLEYEQVMNKEVTPITIDFEDGSTSVVSAGELYDLVFNTDKKLILTANGTIFTYAKPGIIPSLLTRWFTERKQLQAEQKKYANLYDTETDPNKKQEYKKQAEFYDQRQLIRKINLNSLYGALGNKGSRFFDQRIAQSTTLSGRLIAKHMGSKINEIMTGDYNHLGISIIYQDTDSAYFSAYPVMKDKEEFKDFEWSKENVTKLYDSIGEITNKSFPSFMQSVFNCPETNGQMIKANRELCASKGIFITKKRYAVLIYDKEGKRKDIDGPGQIKAMGLDLKRSDTPKIVQEFLSQILLDVLIDTPQGDIQSKITKFRKEFRSWPGWLQGSPKRANNITHYHDIIAKSISEGTKKKVTIPGHVLASINWNKLKKIHGDNYSMPIQDGFKVVVCKLKNNPTGMTSVAYPADELQLPDWFKKLPFDSEAMENALIDKKIENLLGVLKWDLRTNREDNNFKDLFVF